MYNIIKRTDAGYMMSITENGVRSVVRKLIDDVLSHNLVVSYLL